MADKLRKRRISPKQRATALFHLWHNLQDLKADTAPLKDGELGLLMGMVELLVEERIAGLNVVNGSALTAVSAAHPH
jgi:hypothetical protein